MLENMASNVLGMHEWANNLTKLASRGMNKDLLDELTMKGPEAYKEVAAFAQMTAEQLSEANNLYLMYGRTQTLVENQAKANIDFAGGNKNALKGFLNPDGLFGLSESTLEDVNKALEFYESHLNKKVSKLVVTEKTIAYEGGYDVGGNLRERGLQPHCSEGYFFCL